MIKTTCTVCLTLVVVATGTVAGAAERATIVYVDDGASPGGDGLIWSTAFKYVRDARDYAFFHPETNEIRVAGGIYYPDQNEMFPSGSGLRDWTFQLLNNVAINGGYRGLEGGGDPDDRDLIAFESVLSGEIGDPGVTTDNSYHVVSGTGKDSTAIIDGFTITAGRADGTTPHDDGGGFLNTGGSPTLANCRFEDNYAVDDGAGMWYVGTGTDFSLEGCTFTDNACGGCGAGAGIDNCGAVTFTGCTVTNNAASGNQGGGVIISGGGGADITFTDCTLNNNSAPDLGGAVSDIDGGTLYLTNCDFSGNSVSTTQSGNGYGGAVFCESTIAFGCTFTGNSATSSGGGIGYSGRGGGIYAASSANLSECDFTDNTAQGNDNSGDWKGMGGAVFTGSSMSAIDCSFTNNLALAWGSNVVWSGRGGAISTNNLTVIRCVFTDNRALYTSTDDDDGCAQGGAICTTALDEAMNCSFVNNSAVHLGEWHARGGAVYAASAVLNDCSFSANSAYGSGSYDGYGGALYVHGNFSVVTHCTFTGNSAEYQGGAVYTDDATDTFIDCTFINNQAIDAGGGAIHRYTDGEDPGLARNCVFLNNTCGGYGGAIRQETSTFNLVGCSFIGNAAGGRGGAMCHDGISQFITDCMFIDNSSDTDGGAVLLDLGCSPTVSGCVFHRNRAFGNGGALACTNGSSPRVISSVLSDNHADVGGGGGYFFSGSDAELTNLAFWRNSAGISGGAVYVDSSVLTIDNSILWEDTPSEVYDNNWQVQICYCDIQGGWPYCQGNMNSSPLFFARPPGTWTAAAAYNAETGMTTFFDGTASWTNKELSNLLLNPDTMFGKRLMIAANTGNTISVWGDHAATGTIGVTYEIDDFHLSEGSPCIDAGDPTFLMDPADPDIDGELRVWDGDNSGLALVDMGTDEFGSRMYGDLDCDGSTDVFDIDAFVMAIINPTEYATVYPDCYSMLADCNWDGATDIFDIDAFVALITGR
ncbi:MAG: hypothetical protein JXO22_07260 [Phycisphaerae bacterium]|nr:hypothetical protein [Phycisphaerae bacterium]